VVGGQHDGHAVPTHLAQQLPRRTPGRWIHPGGRLVDEDEVGTTHDRHRELEPLLLAARQPSVGGATAVPEPQALGQGVDVERLGVQPRDVTQHLQRPDAGPGAAVLEHHPDPGQEVSPLRLWVQTQHRDGAFLRSAVALARLQSRRLARTVGAEDGGDRVPVDGQVEVVDRDLVAVAHHQPGDRHSGPEGSRGHG
jgi:hypothetical protein